MGAPQLIGPALTETSQQVGAILSLTTVSVGSGYTAFFGANGAPLVGGTGSGATVNLTFTTGGLLLQASVADPGIGYTVGDVLTVPSVTPGSGLTFSVASVNGRTRIDDDLLVTGRLNANNDAYVAPNNIGKPTAFTSQGVIVFPALPSGAFQTGGGRGNVNTVCTTVGNPGNLVQVTPQLAAYGAIKFYKYNFIAEAPGTFSTSFANYDLVSSSAPSVGGPVNHQSIIRQGINQLGNDWLSTAGSIRLDQDLVSASISGTPSISPGEIFRVQQYSPGGGCFATVPLIINTWHDFRAFCSLNGSAHFLRQHFGINLERLSVSAGSRCDHSVPLNIQEERAFASNYIRPKTYFGKARAYPHTPASPASVEVEAVNTIFAGTLTNGGTGYTSGTYNAVALTGGSGTGATANIVVTSGVVTSVTIVSSGAGYAAGNALSCASIGPGVNFVWTVNSIQGDGSVRLNSTGAIFDASNSSTNGVRFFNRGGAVTSSTLNWYEEGTYTPTQVGYTLGACTATWTRIGRKVFVTLNFAAGTTNGSAGAASIGLPAGLAPVRSGLGLRAQPTGAASGNGLVAANAATGNIEISTAVSLDTNAKVIQVEYEV